MHRIKVRYKQSRVGVFWAVLQPLAMMVVFTLMFSFIGGVPDRGRSLRGFCLLGSASMDRVLERPFKRLWLPDQPRLAADQGRLSPRDPAGHLRRRRTRRSGDWLEARSPP